MTKSVNIILAVAAIAFTASTVNVSAANAGQFEPSTKLSAKLPGVELAYAPQDNPSDHRFDQFESEEDLHELNDAWLGMPVVSEDGETIGFVEDAYLDDNGEVSELLISLTDRKIAVYVEGEMATLFDAEVAVSMSTDAIASLEQEEDFRIVSR